MKDIIINSNSLRDADVYHYLFTSAAVSFDTQNFYLNKEILKNSPFNQIKLKFRDGQNKIFKRKDIKFTYSEESWKKVEDWNGNIKFERKKVITIKLPIKKIPSLEIVIKHKETKNKLNGPLDHPVSYMNFTNSYDITPFFRSRGSDIPHNKYSSKKEITWPANLNYSFPIIANNFIKNSKCFLATDIAQDEKKSFSIVSKYLRTPFQKTIMLSLKKVNLTGILSKPISISHRDAMFYIPVHHNFYYEYGIDLYLADNLSFELKQELIKKKVRYLVISGQSTPGLDGSRQVNLSLMGDSGTKIDLGKMNNQFKSVLKPISFCR